MKTGAFGLLEGAGQRDADVGVLALARAVHDAAHHRHLHLLHAGVALAPHRHLLVDVALDLLRQLLEERAGRAAAAGARRDLRREVAEAQRLQDLLRDPHLFGPVAAGRGVSETRIVSPIPSCNRIDSAAVLATIPFVPMPGLGEAQVQRVVAERRPAAVDGIRSCTPLSLALRMIWSCASPHRSASAAERRALSHHRVQHHRLGVLRLGALARSRPSSR